MTKLQSVKSKQSYSSSETVQLYILGDLFDAWLRDALNLPQFHLIISAFKRATEKGVGIFLLTGNRDFMLGHAFFEKSGIQAISDPYVMPVELCCHGQKVMLCHGDFFCTDDKNYQRMRFFLQNSVSKFFLKIIPVNWLFAFVKVLKRVTHKDKAQKSTEIMDVNRHTVDQFLTRYQCDVLIHGHTHRPKIHMHSNAKRYVLGDWQGTGEILVYQNHTFEFLTPIGNGQATFAQIR